MSFLPSQFGLVWKYNGCGVNRLMIEGRLPLCLINRKYHLVDKHHIVHDNGPVGTGLSREEDAGQVGA